MLGRVRPTGHLVAEDGAGAYLPAMMSIPEIGAALELARASAYPSREASMVNELLRSLRELLAAADKIATRRRPGTTSRRTSSRLPAASGDWLDRPVTLPPGRARLAVEPQLVVLG